MGIYIISVLCIVIGIAIDQYTKYLAVTQLQNAPIPIIEGVFELRYLENRGASFGILQNQQWLFLIITVILLVIITRLYIKLPRSKRTWPLRICMLLITAGAIGNMIDRIRLGYVVDFLYFKLIDFPIFNVADIYVTVSTLLIVFLILFYYKEEEFDNILKEFWGKQNQKQE